MKTEMTIRDADNGMMVEGEEWATVIEDNHSKYDKDKDKDNLIFCLGKIFHEEILQGMEAEMSNNIKLKIEITRID